MSWLDNIRPKIRRVLGRRETPDNLWHKCPECSQMIFHKEMAERQSVCPNCDHHMRIGPAIRFKALFDGGVYEVLDQPMVAEDPLSFRDQKRYTEHLKAAKAKSGVEESVATGLGRIAGETAVISVQDFSFMGGSMGLAAGESILKAVETAVQHRCPLIMISSSGGARMQEGILSLMQMPRTTIAVQLMREAGLPYIVVLADPTSGGVLASFAMLGDISIAEPNALLAFTGPRVIEQTIRQQLPEGFQRSDFLLEHGMIDMIVHRHELKSTLSRVLALLSRKNAAPIKTAAQ